ncbi:MAG: 6-pyruvoyl-tetrahydropterin synthase-related protein [Thermoflexales bacterium]|nr:6-pyruvoyl-tetrahydropterin synthase-related protein [Thermoflexales bacterium]
MSRVALIVAVCTSAVWQLWSGEGLLNTRAGGDSPFLLVRTFELAENLRAGAFPARWMPNAAYGFGYPFFYFYAALPYYIAAGLHIVGVDLLSAIKLTQTAGMFGAAAAMYLLAQARLSRAGATLAACAYALAPFHLVNLYVRGDSLSEFWAFAWFPLILWGIERVGGGDWRALPALSGALAALAVTHNVSVMLFAPIAVLWSLKVLLCQGASWQTRLLHLLGLFGAATLGLALSAWFWLPALALAPAVQLGDQTTGYFYFANHFRAGDLIQSTLAFDYGSSEVGKAFAMGLVQSGLIALGGLVWLVAALRRRQVGEWLAIAALFGLTTLMITPDSAPIWEALPPLQLAQFPWRWLSVQSVFASLLIGGLGGLRLEQERAVILRTPTYVAYQRTTEVLPSSPVARFAVVLATLVLGWAMLTSVPNERLNIRQADVNPKTIQLYEWYSGNIGTTIRAEYLPAAMTPRPYVGFGVLGMKLQALPAEEGLSPEALDSEQTSRGAVEQRWRVRLTREGAIVLPAAALPGMNVSVNGSAPRAAQPYEGSGWVWLRLPAGEHNVRLFYQPLPVEQIANAIALTGLMVWLITTVAALRALPVMQRQALAGLGVFGLVALTATHLWFRAFPVHHEPPPMRALDFERRPFPHRGPIFFWGTGDEFVLIAAQVDPPVVRPGEWFTLTLRWRDDRAPAGITVTQELPVGGVPMPLFRYARQQTPGDPRQSAHQTLADLPGQSLLTIQAYDNQGRLLRTRTSDGQPLRAFIAGGFTDGATLLGPHVQASASLPQSTPLHVFKNGIALQYLDWFFTSYQDVCFRPRWRLVRANGNRADALQVSLRLYDGAGVLRAQADAQPLGGLMPTWAWSVSHIINDSLCTPMRRPPALSPNEPYALEVVWYRLATRTEIDRVVLRGVSVGVEGLHEPQP